MYDFVIELPHLNLFSGGIVRSLDLAKELSKEYKIHIRIQNLKGVIPNLQFDYSIGLPSPFLKSKYIITYSDNPFTEDLIKNNTDSKIFVLMLSYGVP